MKLLGNLRNQVEKASTKEEAKGLIEKAGMSLTADELEMVCGGVSRENPDWEPDFDDGGLKELNSHSW